MKEEEEGSQPLDLSSQLGQLWEAGPSSHTEDAPDIWLLAVGAPLASSTCRAETRFSGFEDDSRRTRESFPPGGRVRFKSPHSPARPTALSGSVNKRGLVSGLMSFALDGDRVAGGAVRP